MNYDHQPHRLITIKECGRRLGGKCARTVLRLAERDKRFPKFIVLSGQHHFAEAELDAYIGELVAAPLP